MSKEKILVVEIQGQEYAPYQSRVNNSDTGQTTRRPEQMPVAVSSFFASAVKNYTEITKR